MLGALAKMGETAVKPPTLDDIFADFTNSQVRGAQNERFAEYRPVIRAAGGKLVWTNYGKLVILKASFDNKLSKHT